MNINQSVIVNGGGGGVLCALANISHNTNLSNHFNYSSVMCTHMKHACIVSTSQEERQPVQLGCISQTHKKSIIGTKAREQKYKSKWTEIYCISAQIKRKTEKRFPSFLRRRHKFFKSTSKFFMIAS